MTSSTFSTPDVLAPSECAPPPTTHRRGLSFRQRDTLQGYLLLIPSFVFIGLIIGYPLVRSVLLSLNRFKITAGIDSERFCGLCNYISLARDPYLHIYVRNQAVWVLGATFLPILLALALALLMNQELRLRWLWRAVILIPWMMPVATSALTWRWIYDKQWGLLNHYLKLSGLISENVGFLTERAWLWPSIFLVAMWMWFPYNYVALLAALQCIPSELYEAAKVDGATPLASFWYITLPGIMPVLSLLTILGAIWSMNDFTTIYLLTQGGPGVDSTTMAPLVYNISFRYLDLGKGAATGVTLMSISLIFAIIYIRRSQTEN
ncbi:MAG: sugar ABC transporter permease [Anaerolineae bacterium]|nr:sugar ABC transporter permease [Anaerolineae bacterium]